jgi:hypothetical protein
LGFVVIRPIKDSDGNPLIGRSLLKTYPSKEDGDKRFFVSVDYDVSLFGIPLKVKSLPFQVQDQGVSACATIALWTALHPLADAFGIPRLSPAEITEKSTSFPSEYRTFPSGGLNWEQMINYVKSVGLDVEVINVEETKDDDIILTAIRAYIGAGLPLIGSLALAKEDYTGRHAVVISGYRCDSDGKLTELYVHDDQIGPYSKIKSDGSFKFWKNEWSGGGYKVSLEKLLIPVYPKIRLTFARILHDYLRIKQEIKKEILNAFEADLDLELYLTTVQKYKKFLLEKSIKEKVKILAKSLPRFMWIIRVHYEKQPC